MSQLRCYRRFCRIQNLDSAKTANTAALCYLVLLRNPLLILLSEFIPQLFTIYFWLIRIVLGHEFQMRPPLIDYLRHVISVIEILLFWIYYVLSPRIAQYRRILEPDIVIFRLYAKTGSVILFARGGVCSGDFCSYLHFGET